MNKSLQSIKYLLDQWGEAEAKPVPGLSFSPDSIESRMIESGCATSGTPQRRIPPHRANLQNSLTNQAVQCLDRQQKPIIYQKYVNRTKPESCIEISGLSKAAYYAELNAIYHYLAGSLGYCLNQSRQK